LVEEALTQIGDSKLLEMDLMKNNIGTSLNLIKFIKMHEKSLKSLTLQLMSIPSHGWDFVGDLKEMRLESLSVEFYDGDNDMFAQFLLQNATTLKSLSLSYCGVSDIMLEVVSESLQNLEELDLGGEFIEITTGFAALQKLKHLKKFSGLSSGQNLVEAFGLVVNENMLELKAPFRGKTINFIARLGACLPNLRKIQTGIVSASQVKAILIGFPNLEALDINPDIVPMTLLHDINDHGVKLMFVDFHMIPRLSEE
jgi:hypothetical protein